MQIEIGKTLDVGIVERQLAELWNQTSDSVVMTDDFAVMRARVANLIAYIPKRSSLAEVKKIVAELTAIHPSRVLLLVGENETADRDIEMSVETFCQTDKQTGAKRLCCEEITLQASGSFVGELPSAALPLAVPDLTTFLWWRDALVADNARPDKSFDALLRACDRLILDSADFGKPNADLLAVSKLFDKKDYAHVGISDLNWARLTSWRALLAGFFDVPAYQRQLDSVDTVRVTYIAPDAFLEGGQDARAPGAAAIAPQALLIAGWLASRLDWKLTADQAPGENNAALVLNFSGKSRGSSPTVREGSGDREIKHEFNRVEHAQGKPGRLVQVELQSESASFEVSRSADNSHLATEARMDDDVHRGRVIPVRNRSAAQLLGREMEILCNDQIYQEAVAMVARMIDGSRALR